VAPLIAITDRDQLLMTSRSSIILLSDRGKPYTELAFMLFDSLDPGPRLLFS